jgi:hypothetical protein
MYHWLELQTEQLVGFIDGFHVHTLTILFHIAGESVFDSNAEIRDRKTHSVFCLSYGLTGTRSSSGGAPVFDNYIRLDGS